MDKQILQALEKLQKQVEDIRIDTHSTKTDVKLTKLLQDSLAHNVEMLKITQEKMEGKLEPIIQDINHLKKMTQQTLHLVTDIAEQAVAENDLHALEKRIAILESAQN